VTVRPALAWDIFCTVVDNFGDTGVCWRLARQLAGEHGQQVRLWVDDLASLQRLCPEVSPQQDIQLCRNIEIRRWSQPFPEVTPAQVVIEAFACELPQNYLAAMARQTSKLVWINLEYLSAESWVEGCHGLPSPHPQLPLTKYFFFPGFTSATGGLLREQAMVSHRDALQHNPAELWQSVGLAMPASDETIISLFCYDSAPITDLLGAWATSATPLRCLLPEGKALAQTAAWFGKSAVAPGDTLQHDSLSVQILPFLAQEKYDQLLWACDCNFVRGEDSFVRAQWAARPMVWQAYPQQDGTHFAKLDTFLDLYCTGLDENAAVAVRALHQEWNSQKKPCWDTFWQHRTALQAHAATWAARLAAQPDLASKLVIFCQNRV